MDSLHSLEGCTAGALEASEGDHKGCLPAADHTDWLMEDTLGAGCKVVVHHMRRHHKMLQGVAHSHRMHPQLPGEVPCTQVACMEGPDRNSPQGVGWHTPQTLTCMGLGMEVGTGAGWGKAPLVQLNTAGHMRWNKGHWGPMGWVGPQGACCSHTGPGPQASLQLCPVQSPQEGQPKECSGDRNECRYARARTGQQATEQNMGRFAWDPVYAAFNLRRFAVTRPTQR